MRVSQCVITPKSMSQSDFYISQKEGHFSLFFSVSSSRQPRISGQRLMMQRPYCAFAVEQKSQRHSFKASAPRKQRHLHNPAPLPLRADREETRWSQGWGSGNVMYALWNIGPYPTQVVALAPKPILTVCEALRRMCEGSVAECACEGTEPAGSHCTLYIYIYRFFFFFFKTLVCLLTYSICLQLCQICPFPESFLRAISSAEEFSPLPIASSTTGGPIILIPYRDGEREGWGGLQGLFKGDSLPSLTLFYFLKRSALKANL